MTVPQTLTLAEFLASSDAVVEWHMLPEPAERDDEVDAWMPEYDDEA